MSDQKKEQRGKHPWMENFEGLSLAIIMALTLKYFVIEAYKIPTGSMQPTLMGVDQPGLQIFDRILVDKLAYLGEEPKRWEVIVFKYPLEQSKNYIKRLIGLPGETIKIQGGNLYRRDINGRLEILRKPWKTQEDVWKTVYNSAELAEETRAAEDFWIQEAGKWSFDGDSLQILGAGKLRFRKTIKDIYEDGYPTAIRSQIAPYGRDSGIEIVGDLRIGFRVDPNPECQSVQCTLGCGDRRYLLSLSGPAGDGTSKILIGKDILETIRFKLSAKKPTQIRFAHVDERVTLEIDGKRIFTYDFPDSQDLRTTVSGNLVEIETVGSGAIFRGTQIDRDLYYTYAQPGEWTVPPGHFFFLGDNTQNSYDGRLWNEAICVLGTPGPNSKEVTLHGDSRGSEPNPRLITVENGESIYAFTDWFGEVHRFPDHLRRKDKDLTRDHPFVPREFIVGKAILVFWPVPPFSPIPRWKLVY